MEEIQVTAHFKIHSGKIVAFKKIAALCMEVVKERDTGTLQYDWFYSPDGGECKVRETYVDSDAFLEHSSHVGAFIGKFLEISDFSAEIYGSPTEQLKRALQDMDISYFTFEGGIG